MNDEQNLIRRYILIRIAPETEMSDIRPFFAGYRISGIWPDIYCKLFIQQFLVLHFLIQNSFSGHISGQIPDTKKGWISGRPDIR